MKLSHAGKYRLPRLLVLAELARRILGCKRLHGIYEFVLVSAGLRLDGEEHDGLRRGYSFKIAGFHLRTQSVAGRGLFKPHKRSDVTGGELIDLDLIIRKKTHDLHHALALLGARIVHIRTFLQDAAVYAHEEETPHKRVCGDLEHKRRKKLAVALLARNGLSALEIRRDDGRTVLGTRKIPRDRVKQRLYTLVAERCAAKDGNDPVGDDKTAERALEFGCSQVAVLEIRLHDAFIEICDAFAKFGSSQLRVILQFGRDFAYGEILAVRLLVIDDTLHLDEIYYADKSILLADGKLHRDGVRLQLFAKFLYHAHEVRAHAVHLVHERDPRHGIAVRLPPHGLGLRLNAADGAEYADGSV